MWQWREGEGVGGGQLVAPVGAQAQGAEELLREGEREGVPGAGVVQGEGGVAPAGRGRVGAAA